MSKNAAGMGSIRKKTVTRNGKSYTYFEARYTSGYDPGTGRQIQRSITGKTQKEVAQKLKAATAAIDAGTYQEPNKMTVGQWLDTWAAEYLGGVKPRTVDSYKATVKNHLKPNLGAVRLDQLDTDTIQAMYNRLSATLSPKSIKNTHGVLHKALQQAVKSKKIKYNPADGCVLPKVDKPEIHPLDDSQITAFLEAIRGHRYEYLYTVTLFTGMREGEALGLTWDAVDLDSGTIIINKQLQRLRDGSGDYALVPTKNSKGRSVTVAPFVVSILRKVQTRQKVWQLQSAGCWDNPQGLVFTNELGGNLSAQTVYLDFKKVVKSLGTGQTRFHDLRHSFAVASLQAGDDIKTVQENMGHYSAAFTLDVYGHVTAKMRKDSAARMENYIKSVSNG